MTHCYRDYKKTSTIDIIQLYVDYPQFHPFADHTEGIMGFQKMKSINVIANW
jgi:hypothetical protein